MRFDNKVALITGASRGIGKAAAQAFAREGARTALISLEAEEGEALAQELRQGGAAALHLVVDVAEAKQVRQAVERVTEAWGRLDVLVNNAGIYLQGNVEATEEADWQRIVAVNLTGPFLCTKYAVPAMRAAGGGAVVNVASEAGLVGIKGQVAYNVSKAGLIGLTRSCAVDLAVLGIRVNCICPGTTDTPLVQEAVHRSADPAAARRALEQVRPLDRLGRPEEIAAGILFLASEEAGYATGAVLSIDGGYTAQ
jgi:NAD(P)-dependent dehydrogenase (short-subunit alcohol dehydrogenase family)